MGGQQEIRVEINLLWHTSLPIPLNIKRVEIWWKGGLVGYWHNGLRASSRQISFLDKLAVGPSKDSNYIDI